MLVARFNTDVRCTEHKTNVKIGNGDSMDDNVVMARVSGVLPVQQPRG